MAHFQSNAAKGIETLPYPAFAGATVSKRFQVALTAAQLGTLNLIAELGVLPKDCRLIDLELDSDDLDTNGAPTISLDVGLMSGDFGSMDQARTVGQEMIAGSTIARTGGVERMSKVSGFRIAPAAVDRSIGVKIAAVAATPAAGVIGIIATFATE